ncbi:hypothetical protein [Corallococcus exiguus]|uniref:hypothetical protein n=1 Tax=Corallococcus exiguus TaxID=83462 RepID=UPI001494CE7D|nr:hypothetical protein [Corallococcus exiguus]NPD27179.1 hypothetical protein [Corallococcus exiguus]
MALILENKTQEHVAFPGACWLVFPFTDCKSEVHVVWDSATDDTIWEWQADTDESGAHVVKARLAGYVPANGERTIGVHAVRRKLAAVSRSVVSFSDSVGHTTMGPISAQSVTVQSTVVFPPSDARRALLADNAIEYTSRTVTWESALAEYGFERIHASVRTSYLAAAPRRLDDAIAEVHRVLALDGVGKSAECMDGLRRNLTPFLGEDSGSPDCVLELISDFGEMESAARRRVLGGLLSKLHTLRSGLMQEFGARTVSDDVAGLAERISCEVSDCLLRGAVHTPPPVEFWDSLLSLIQFAKIYRQADFRELDCDAKEEALHNVLERFLLGQADAVFREPEVGNGRIDLLLRNTPVELKVDDLGERPRDAIERHKQQAAEYASRKNVSVAVLVVLDVHRPRSGGRHQPHLSEQVRVLQADSRGGILGCSVTAVVAIALSACNSRPHELKKTTRGKSASKLKALGAAGKRLGGSSKRTRS